MTTARARFKTDYATIEDMAAAARDIAIREGEEGTVVMKKRQRRSAAESERERCLVWSGGV